MGDLLNIILCGLPKSGKTKIGKLLAKKMAWNFIDTDHLIELSYAKMIGKKLTCREIFLLEGQELFRKLEKEQVKLLPKCEKHVIGLGGGTLENESNRNHLKNLGQIFYLKAPEKMIFERIKRGKIPGYLDPNNLDRSFYELAKKRTAHYEEMAHYIIDISDLKETETVLKIFNMMRK